MSAPQEFVYSVVMSGGALAVFGLCWVLFDTARAFLAWRRSWRNYREYQRWR